MRVLVTGCAGFIGSHVAEELVRHRYEVIGIDCFTPYYPRVIKEYNLVGLMSNASFRLIEADISCMTVDQVISLLSGVKYVIHEAAQPGVRGSWGEGFKDYVINNIVITQLLLEAARKVKSVEKIVYASSSSVYGNLKLDHGKSIKEDSELNPYSPYGVTKLATEKLCNAYYENFSIPIVSLRYFTVYGPRQRPDMAFYKFIKSMLTGETIHIYGSGHQKRDFTYVGSVVEATLKAMETGGIEGEVINIASGRALELIDIIKTMADIIGVEPKINYEEKREGDVDVTYAEITKARKLLDYDPKISIREGLEKEVDYINRLLTMGIIR